MTSNAGDLKNESRTILEWQRRIANGERFNKLDIVEFRKFGMWLFELERIEHANNPHMILAGFAILKKELGVVLCGIERSLGVNVGPILEDWRNRPAWRRLEAAALAGERLATMKQGTTPRALREALNNCSDQSLTRYAKAARVRSRKRGRRGATDMYSQQEVVAICDAIISDEGVAKETRDAAEALVGRSNPH